MIAVSPGDWHTQLLLKIRSTVFADFFHRTEPHSPVAYLASRAVQWGNMPLHEWLRTVIKDGSTLAQVEELLGMGVSPKNDEPG